MAVSNEMLALALVWTVCLWLLFRKGTMRLYRMLLAISLVTIALTTVTIDDSPVMFAFFGVSVIIAFIKFAPDVASLTTKD